MRNIEYSRERHRLIIRESVLQTMHSGKDKAGLKEIGGILLGTVYTSHCEIVRATIPNKYDKCGRTDFVRSKRGAQLEIIHEWKNSTGTIIYLGEWHSHFENNPTPSLVDRALIANSLK